MPFAGHKKIIIQIKFQSFCHVHSWSMHNKVPCLLPITVQSKEERKKRQKKAKSPVLFPESREGFAPSCSLCTTLQ